MARIKLVRFEIGNGVSHRYVKGFRLRVVAEDAEGMPNEVFRFKRPPPNPLTGVTEDVFDGVCSFPDLAEYPALGPVAGTPEPFFRRAVVELDLRSQHDYDAVWRDIVDQVCVLRKSVELAAVLTPAEVVWCEGPDAAPPVDSLTSESLVG